MILREIESRGHVVNTPASYLGVPVQISTWMPAILTGFRGFPQSVHENDATVP
jgi:hypothetical protein